jgi:predicted RND superfamily exporter protein
MQIDASADTLLLDNDKDLAFSREVSKTYGEDDYLIITYSPNDKKLFSTFSINTLKNISNDLVKLPLVHDVISILNVPLLQSPSQPVSKLLKNFPNLLSKNTDKKLAKLEFLQSPLYKENLVSQDFKTTALLVNLNKIQSKEQNHNNILKVRQIINEYRNTATIHLGGMTMIADDLINFVKSDLEVFSVVIFILLILILYILFRELKWVILPLIICTISILATTGILGFFEWKVTIISSNFISLQLIMTMSLVIHLTIKYKELYILNPHLSQKELLHQTMIKMIKPSFFVILTTIAGFSSLIFSSILPVINFGYMMSLGLILSFILTFLLFPILLLVFTKISDSQKQSDNNFTTILANIAYKNQKIIILSAMLIIIFSISGAKQLFIENSFIKYFKSNTEIYQGMKIIDEKLGGTTPLDIIITFKKDKQIEIASVIDNNIDEESDDFLEEFSNNSNDQTYWFTIYKMEQIRKAHKYLESLPEIGKVLSLSTLDEVGKILNKGKYLDGFELALLNQKLPQQYKNLLLRPYINIEKNQARITTRIIDSLPTLRRHQLITKINNDLSHILNVKNENFKLSNLLILYDNMLQSLFKSQISTLGFVITILFFMFLLLFRSIYISFIAMIVNIIPVGVIFGVMGWSAIPLDMMTITIAAISIGIAVDNTIHYIHRFKLEFNQTNNYKQSLFNTHKSIGTAMFYTSFIIIIGFSVLILSNFVPTIYFGILTLIAMFMAILSDLLLLPILLLLLKPFKEAKV